MVSVVNPPYGDILRLIERSSLFLILTLNGRDRIKHKKIIPHLKTVSGSEAIFYLEQTLHYSRRILSLKLKDKIKPLNFMVSKKTNTVIN